MTSTAREYFTVELRLRLPGEAVQPSLSSAPAWRVSCASSAPNQAEVLHRTVAPALCGDRRDSW